MIEKTCLGLAVCLRLCSDMLVHRGGRGGCGIENLDLALSFSPDPTVHTDAHPGPTLALESDLLNVQHWEKDQEQVSFRSPQGEAEFSVRQKQKKTTTALFISASFRLTESCEKAFGHFSKADFPLIVVICPVF